MIHFTKDKFISTYADVFEIAIQGHGYVLVSKDIYDALLRAEASVDMELRKRTLDISANGTACKYFEETVPSPLNCLAFMFDRLQFEIENDLEQLFGVLHVMLTFNSVHKLLSMEPAEFHNLRYSDMILTEYVLPRRTYLTSCIPYDEMINPEKAEGNKHNFLYLVPMSAMTGMAGAMPTFIPGIQDAGMSASSNALNNDPDDYKYYLDRKEQYKYEGDGLFKEISTGIRTQIDTWDDSVLNEAYGIESVSIEEILNEWAEESGEELPADIGPSTVGGTFAPSSALAEDNADVQKQVSQTFNAIRERRIQQ